MSSRIARSSSEAAIVDVAAADELELPARPARRAAAQRSWARSAERASETGRAAAGLVALARERQQRGQQAREPLDLLLGGLELRLRLADRPSRRADSSRSRSPVSGVRSWCEALATNSRWAASTVPSRSAMSLKAAATSRCSVAPVDLGPRFEVAGLDPPRRGGELAQRPRERARQEPREREPEDEREGADRDQREHAAADPVMDRGQALRDADRADDLAVVR